MQSLTLAILEIMNVSNILLLFFLMPLSINAQEKNIYFLLEENNSQYVYFINGKLNCDPQNFNEVNFFITSKENYSQLKRNHKLIILGEPMVTPGLKFKSKDFSIINECEFNELKTVDFNWLTKNQRILTPEYIELNNFENLSLILKVKESYIVFDVVREFTSK